MEAVFTEVSPMAGVVRVVPAGATIGRTDCDVVLADPEVSRRHARIREVDGAPAVEDLGSRNGVQVNGRPVAGIAVLADGDELRFGNTVWQFGTRG